MMECDPLGPIVVPKRPLTEFAEAIQPDVS